MKPLNSIYGWVIAVPILLILLGTASNQAVLVANWGKFPVMVNDRVQAKMIARARERDREESEQSSARFSITNTTVRFDARVMNDQGQFVDDVHSVMGHNSRLKFLADYINLRTAIYSPGDGLIELGEWSWGFAPTLWIFLAARRLYELRG